MRCQPKILRYSKAGSPRLHASKYASHHQACLLAVSGVQSASLQCQIPKLKVSAITHGTAARGWILRKAQWAHLAYMKTCCPTGRPNLWFGDCSAKRSRLTLWLRCSFSISSNFCRRRGSKAINSSACAGVLGSTTSASGAAVPSAGDMALHWGQRLRLSSTLGLGRHR